MTRTIHKFEVIVITDGQADSHALAQDIYELLDCDCLTATQPDGAVVLANPAVVHIGSVAE